MSVHFILCFGATTTRSDASEPDYGIYVASADNGFRDALENILADQQTEPTLEHTDLKP